MSTGSKKRPEGGEPGLNELWKLWKKVAPEQALDQKSAQRWAARALDYGEAFMAYDFAAAGLRQGSNPRLLQQQALALARTGSTQRAQAILQQLRDQGRLDEETLGLLARTYKDLWRRETDSNNRASFLKSSLQLYREAYELTGGYYSGINFASLCWMAGEQELAKSTAEQVRTQLGQNDTSADDRLWRHASVAEACLLLGETTQARRLYKRLAREFYGKSPAAIGRVRDQASWLADAILGNHEVFADCFDLGQVVVFAGHMFDTPNLRHPRLPYSSEPLLRATINSALKKMNVRFGYCSLACGSDLLFAEAMLKRGGQLHVVLPFPPAEFIGVSVNVVPGVDFRPRFDAVLEQASSVTVLSDWVTSQDEIDFIFATDVLNGLALIKARTLGLELVPLAVWDGLPGAGEGGTERFVSYWRSCGCQPTIIRPPANAKRPLASTQPLNLAKTRSIPPRSGIRTIRGLVFADVVGYSKLTDPETLVFANKVLAKIAEAVRALPRPPVFINTWGDAVFAAFERLQEAGRFALELRDLFRITDWRACGFRSELQVRIGLHAGPVYTCSDPLLKKTVCTGAHVSRAARIEPITEEGQVFASATFAALAEANRVSSFSLDYAGTRPLAKKAGAMPVFLLRWSGTKPTEVQKAIQVSTPKTM
jgi:class 3 adenylate cyclase